MTYQYGVPTKELAGQAMEAEPKSASLTCPGSVSKMFPALISLSNTYKNISQYHTEDATLESTGTEYPAETLTGEPCCGSEGKTTLEEHHE